MRDSGTNPCRPVKRAAIRTPGPSGIVAVMRRTVGIVALVGLSTAVTAPAQAGGPADQEITATVETPSLFDDEADDPAIWINRADRARSRVTCTAKNGGLRVYDLAGREVQLIAPPADGR